MADPTTANALLSWEAITALGTMASVLVTGWVSLRSQAAKQHDTVLAKMDAMREASEEGRSRIYQRIDGVVHELRAEFVSKELHTLTMKRVESLDERLNRACEDVRARRTGASTLMT